MRAEPILASVLCLLGASALAQFPAGSDKSSVAAESVADAPEDTEKEELSAQEIFRRFAPRLLFLKPDVAEDLKLAEDLSVEVQLVIKNALKQEGSFRVRTMGDLELDDEQLFMEAKDCADDACLYKALNQTAVGQFLRTRVVAAPNKGLRVLITGHRVDQQKSYRAVDFVVRADPVIGAVGEVLLRRLRRESRMAIYALPPAPMVNGTPPSFNASITVMAPTGASIKVNNEAAGEVIELDLFRLERNGGKRFDVEVSLPGHQPAKASVDLAPGQAAFVELTPKRSEETKKVTAEAVQKGPRFASVTVKMKVKSGADVYLDGRWIGENPLTYNRCPAGPHKVVIRHPLYYRLWRQITCVPGGSIKLEAEMLPRYGKVSVTSSVKGAGVLLDGDPVGRTPLLIDEVPSGKHTVQILDETWQSKPVKFKLVEHRTASFKLPVRKRFGEVLIVGTTEGLTASAKGRKVRVKGGESVLKIPPGKAKITCQAPFHRTVRQFVSIRRGRKVTIKCQLEAVSARLVVTDGGQPGRLMIDGKAVARVPAEVAIEPGDHQVVIEPDSQSYEPYKTTITVANKGVARVNPTYSAMVGGLEVNSEPVGSTVFLDGRPIGETPLLRKDLAVGIYSLEIRKKGFNPYGRRVVIAMDELERVRGAALTRRGQLKVSTAVPGATIVVGGVPMGVTPALIDDLPQGLYEMRAEREGFAARVLEVEVRNGQDASVTFRRLVPLSLVNARFYDRVPVGRYLFFGGLSALGLGVAARYSGAAMTESAVATYELANRKRSVDGALTQMQSGRDQANQGQWLEGSGYALAGIGASALSWFTLQFPWGDL